MIDKIDLNGPNTEAEAYKAFGLIQEKVVLAFVEELDAEKKQLQAMQVMADGMIQIFATNRTAVEKLLSDPEASLRHMAEAEILPSDLSAWITQHADHKKPDSNTNILRRRFSRLDARDIKHLKLEPQKLFELKASVVMFQTIQRNGLPTTIAITQSLRDHPRAVQVVSPSIMPGRG